MYRVEYFGSVHYEVHKEEDNRISMHYFHEDDKEEAERVYHNLLT
jgi:hypothetical protein